jgi:hypothetical protein
MLAVPEGRVSLRRRQRCGPGNLGQMFGTVGDAPGRGMRLPLLASAAAMFGLHLVGLHSSHANLMEVRLAGRECYPPPIPPRESGIK